MSIEFRVQGKDSAAVAQELADHMKNRFKVEPDVRPLAPAQNDGGGGAPHRSIEVAIAAIGATVTCVDFTIASYHAWLTFYKEPKERQIRHWMDLVHWARAKMPTTVRAVIGKTELLLHVADPERLHELAKKEIASVVVIPEPEPKPAS